jgi:choline-sulfatase
MPDGQLHPSARPLCGARRYWDLYEDCEHLLPEVPAIPYEDHDPHSKRIFDANDWRSFDITEEDIRRSRRAYFANISYLDDKIGEILDTLEATRQEAMISSSPTMATCWASGACGSR